MIYIFEVGRGKLEVGSGFPRRSAEAGHFPLPTSHF
jgi:hypothetical protein